MCHFTTNWFASLKTLNCSLLQALWLACTYQKPNTVHTVDTLNLRLAWQACLEVGLNSKDINKTKLQFGLFQQNEIASRSSFYYSLLAFTASAQLMWLFTLPTTDGPSSGLSPFTMETPFLTRTPGMMIPLRFRTRQPRVLSLNF